MNKITYIEKCSTVPVVQLGSLKGVNTYSFYTYLLVIGHIKCNYIKYNVDYITGDVVNKFL